MKDEGWIYEKKSGKICNTIQYNTIQYNTVLYASFRILATPLQYQHCTVLYCRVE